MKKKTNIDGYNVELDLGNEEFASSCIVSIETRKGKAIGSLEFLMGDDWLETRSGYAHRVNQQTIDAIEQWALDNGY